MSAPAAPDVLSEHQWHTLLAIADAFVGVDTDDAKGSISDTAAQPGLETNPSSCPAFIALLSRTLAQSLPGPAVKEVRIFLSICSGYPAYLINGTTANLYDLPRSQVENILKGWMDSRLKPIRTGAKGLGFILRSIWILSCPGILPEIGHPGHIVPEPVAAERQGAAEMDVLSNAKTVLFGGEPTQEISTSVLVIGSGSGASAFTHSLVRHLQETDWRSLLPPSKDQVSDVLVVEKGTKRSPHIGGTPLPADENAAFESMYEGQGIMASDESAISIIAGSTWGGGSRINWSACLETDRIVREEWTKHIMQDLGKGGDPHGRMFLSREWQDCMEHIQDQLGVQTPTLEEHNPANRCLIDGARKLGYTVKAVPQNISGSFTEHAKCGADCTIGCRGHAEPAAGSEGARGKMSGCRAFLHPLISAGADVADRALKVKGLAGFEVERIIFDKETRKKAVGAIGWVQRGETRVKVLVKAKIVVLSGGTLNSPAVLLRSGVKSLHVGQNLHLHPVVVVHSTWPTEIKPWEGTILTTVINEFSNLDGKGHGVKIEAMCMMPALGMPYAPWEGSAQAWRDRMKAYSRTMGHIILCREESTGRITVDSDGTRRISYVTGAKERAWLNEGFEGIAKLLYVQGAEEIYTSAAGLPIWRRSPSSSSGKGGDWADDQSFLDFLAAYRASGFDIDRMSFGSAHQMGACRMSGSARTGVVDPRGKVWGYEGLYVADASVFPSASGVNPMVTTMAFGEWIGRRVVEGLRGQANAAEEAVKARL